MGAFAAGILAVGLVAGFGVNAMNDGGGEPAAEECPGGCAMVAATPSAEHTIGEFVPTRPSSAVQTTRPTASATPTVSPSPARTTASPKPASAGGGLGASYATSRTWGSGFIGSVTVTNRGSSRISGWHLSAVFPGRRIYSAWSSDGTVRIGHHGDRLRGFGPSLPPGGRTTINFQGSGRAGPPSPCILNGRPC
ncbi:cellulose binding domain-containing protein [Actinomadura sp. 9N407]|uniref:cellulose binding domain-containing protein n=1 Tax=Actinomadura sp. 9N407 TaxID=3375154 RepID=UPI0037898C18